MICLSRALCRTVKPRCPEPGSQVIDADTANKMDVILGHLQAMERKGTGFLHKEDVQTLVGADDSCDEEQAQAAKPSCAGSYLLSWPDRRRRVKSTRPSPSRRPKRPAMHCRHSFLKYAP